MDYLKKNKMIGWLVLLLVLLNTATLTKLWLDKGQRGPRGGRGGSEDLLTKELALNKNQLQQIESLRKSHFQTMEVFRSEQHKTRKSLHEQWQEENAEGEVNILSSKIGDLQKSMEVQTYKHFSSIRKLLTDEQKLKFDTIIHDVMRKGDRNMNGPPEGPEGQKGPPRGNRPPPRKRP
jgi:Spy/CpxP family protein refolding chaperone